jgi:hypothetical protein
MCWVRGWKRLFLVVFHSYELKFYLRNNLAIDWLEKQSLDWKIHYFFFVVVL